MECAKCGFDNALEAIECAKCGVIFAKWNAGVSPAGPPASSPAVEDDDVADGRIGRKELIILGTGLGAAIVAHVFPLFRIIFSALVSLLHETGHAIVAWLLGHPSIPAFDFVYGGGFTNYGQFQVSIAIAIAGLFAYAGWLFRRNRRTVAAIAILFVVWLIIVSSA